MASQLLVIGWYVGLCIVLGVLGGRWLDDKLNTSPILVIIGLLVGIIVAFYGLYKMILPYINQKRNGGKS
jgi:ATP synthase protein I